MHLRVFGHGRVAQVVQLGHGRAVVARVRRVLAGDERAQRRREVDGVAALARHRHQRRRHRHVCSNNNNNNNNRKTKQARNWQSAHHGMGPGGGAVMAGPGAAGGGPRAWRGRTRRPRAMAPYLGRGLRWGDFGPSTKGQLCGHWRDGAQVRLPAVDRAFGRILAKSAI